MAGDELLRTVETVHAAGLDSERWTDALVSVSRLFGSVGASLEVFDKRTMTLRDFRLAGLPPGAETPYVEYFAQHNPRAHYAVRHLSEKVLYDYRIVDERAMDRDPYYIEYLRPLGLRYFATTQIVDTQELHGIISVQRSRRQGHVERRDLDRLRRLLPHFSQAYATTMRLAGAADANRSLMHALDWLADGAALVRGDGRVTYVNEALLAIVRRADGVRIVRHRLEFDATEISMRVARALASVRALHAGSLEEAAECDLPVPRPSGAPPYVVSIRPLVRAKREFGTLPEAVAIVFVRDPLQRHQSAIALLRETFGLTLAEASLARALQAGVPLDAYALQAGLSLNTIYTHLRRVKEKTRTRRQTELILKLNQVRLPARER